MFSHWLVCLQGRAAQRSPAVGPKGRSLLLHLERWRQCSQMHLSPRMRRVYKTPTEHLPMIQHWGSFCTWMDSKYRIAGLRRSEHITDALASIRAHQVQTGRHRLPSSSRHCTSVPISDQLQYVADLPSRRRGRLRSSTSSLLDVRPSRLVTVNIT